MSEEFDDPWAVPASAVAEPEGRRNRFAVAGIVCSIAPVLGAAFSVVGLIKSRTAGGTGRRLSVAGLVLSVVFAVLYTLTGLSVAYSAAWDDGCRGMVGDQPWISMFGRDLANIRRDSTSPQWADVLPNNVDGVGYDARDFLQEMQVAEPQGSRSDVRADIQRVERDLDALIELSASADLHRDWTAASVMGALQKFLADAATLTNLCSSYLNFV